MKCYFSSMFNGFAVRCKYLLFSTRKKKKRNHKNSTPYNEKTYKKTHMYTEKVSVWFVAKNKTELNS